MRRLWHERAIRRLLLLRAGDGWTVVVSKSIAAGLPPFSATALRFAIAFPIFVAMMQVRKVRWPKLGARDRWLVIAQAGAGSVSYTVCLIGGMRLASAADAGVIAGSLPAVSAAVAALALGERPSLALLGAIALATLRVLACTVRLDDLTAGRGAHSLAGNAMVFAAIVCEALFVLLNRKLRPWPSRVLSITCSCRLCWGSCCGLRARRGLVAPKRDSCRFRRSRLLLVCCMSRSAGRR
jgi:drug/metabolite transporter (DMT)-like permease